MKISNLKNGGRRDPRFQISTVDLEEEEEDMIEGPTLESQFIAFVKYQNPEDPGTHIVLSQIDFWMKQAGVIQVRTLTKTDTGVCYFHFKKYKLNFEEFKEFLWLLSNRKKILAEAIIDKLVKCGPPNAEELKKP